MDIHTATELAYRNGYICAIEELRTKTSWIDKKGKYVCDKCKAENYRKTKYCPTCGRLVLEMF